MLIRKQACVNNTDISFRTGHRHCLAITDFCRGLLTSDYCGDAQLARNNSSVTGSPATVGHNRSGTFHDRLPIRICHVRYQHITGLNFSHLSGVHNNSRRSLSDLLANRTPLYQHCAPLTQVKLLYRLFSAAFHRFRTGLNNINLSIYSIQCPFDVHRPLVVLLDDYRLSGQ